MSEEQWSENVIVDADFDSAYRTGDMGLGTSLRFEKLPWDLEGPQPAVVELEQRGGMHGEVLDAGCGYGDNARFLAGLGYRVTGIDGSESAIEQARSRAESDVVRPEFVVADATVLDNLDRRFDTVLDSALYHCLSPEQRRAYAEALARVTSPKARLHVYCFADEGAGRFPSALAVSQDDLRANLSTHWDIQGIELEYYATAFDRPMLENALHSGDSDAPALLPIAPDDMRSDEHGRMWVPVWHVTARRA